MALQSDNKIVVLSNSSNVQIILRLDSNGTSDIAYDSDAVDDGILIGTDNMSGGELKLLSDNSSISVAKNELVKYSSSGVKDMTFDTNFNSDAMASSSLQGVNVLGGTLAIDSNDIIYHLTYGEGFQEDGSDGKHFLASYNSDGSVNTTFNSGTVLTIANNHYGHSFPSMTIDSQNKVIIASKTTSSFTPYLHVKKFDSNGSLLASYLESSFQVGVSSQKDIDVALDSNDNLYIIAPSNTTNQSWLVKIQSDLSGLDTSFATTGKIESTNVLNRAITVTTDDKTIVSGANSDNVIVTKYDVNGTLDNTFNSTGIQTITGATSPRIVEVEIDTNNDIVVAGASDTKDFFSVKILNSLANVAPTISGTPTSTIDPTNNYTFTPTAADDNGDTLTFSISNKPSWADFNTSTGILSGTPTINDVNTYSAIIIRVSDGSLSSILLAFNITVNTVPNSAPTITGTPTATIYPTNNYIFTPTSNDVNGDTLIFSILNKPSWADFNTSTGTLSGTPASSDINTYSSITISVSDNNLSATLVAFDIDVEQEFNTINFNEGLNYFSLASHIKLCDQSEGTSNNCNGTYTLESIFGVNANIKYIIKYDSNEKKWFYWDQNDSYNDQLNKFTSVEINEGLLIRTTTNTSITLPKTALSTTYNSIYTSKLNIGWNLVGSSDVTSSTSDLNTMVSSAGLNLKYILLLRNNVWHIYAPKNDSEVDDSIPRLTSVNTNENHWVYIE